MYMKSKINKYKQTKRNLKLIPKDMWDIVGMSGRCIEISETEWENVTVFEVILMKDYLILIN